PLHAQSNMPGKLLAIYGLLNFSRHPAVLAWLVVLLSNLGGVIFYFFVRDLFGDRRVALYALILYFLVPAKLYFFPLLNTLTPALAIACAYLTLKWTRSQRASYAALIGVVVYALILYEPICLVAGVLCAAIVAWSIGRGDMTVSTAARHLVFGVLAFAA